MTMVVISDVLYLHKYSTTKVKKIQEIVNPVDYIFTSLFIFRKISILTNLRRYPIYVKYFITVDFFRINI